MINFYVYKHTCPNGKTYIGITSLELSRRWQNGLGYKRQPYFYNAILKYGWDNIKHEVLFTDLSKEEAEEKEIELIAKYKSNNKKYGYNIANGGNVIGTMSEETKAKISKALKGISKEVSPFKGKHHTTATKIKLSDLKKGNKNPMYGKRILEDTKLKMSKSHKNCTLCKAIICLETGETFISASEVARIMKLSQGNVSAVARGQRKHTKGYHFKYTNMEVMK